MHGSFSRGDTYNNMAAFGPDFKQASTDWAPVSNADLARTIASILNLDLPSNGSLQGRVLKEALVGGPDSGAGRYRVRHSMIGDGVRTYLVTQIYAGKRYYDSACLLPFNPGQREGEDEDDMNFDPCQ